jgi:PIN domain nuclease of toxin-antitoxin system
VRLLLDTHTFIWWNGEPHKLSPHARHLCEEPDAELVLSVVSLWEMQIKLQLGKIQLTQPLPEIVRRQREQNGLTLLSVMAEHVYALSQLPDAHKDPFDRLLIAQAISEGMSIVTRDSAFESYPVPLEW